MTTNSAITVPALHAHRICKRYAGTPVLSNVDLSVKAGEVMALVGKNGAGKSTLVKVFSGAILPDSGTITLGERQYNGFSPISARRAGVATVYQDQQLVPNLSVAENLLLGEEPRLAPGLISRAELNARAAELLSEHGLNLNPRVDLGSLNVAEAQQVMILKALGQKARVLLLDEPTAALNKAQAAFLFELIARLKASGLAVVYVSHYLDEVLALADRVTVLRDGCNVASLNSRETTKREVMAFMVGEAARPEAKQTGAARTPPLNQPVVLDAAYPNGKRVSVQRGEIIGLTGTVGSGAEALARTAGGLGACAATLTLNGRPYAPRTPRQALAQGVVFLPEDMARDGLVFTMSVAGNVTLAAPRRLAPGGLLLGDREIVAVRNLTARMAIEPADPRRETRTLSGGNKRKVLFARALHTGFKLLIAEEPTAGVDIQARAEIHRLVRELVEAGSAMILVSTDLEELTEVTDRIVVMHNGQPSIELNSSSTTPTRLLAYVQGSV